MGDKILLLYDKDNPHQSIRLEWGLAACSLTPDVATTKEEIVSCDFSEYDFVFVEASLDIDLSNKSLGPVVILYDVEDKPTWFDPKKAYYSLLDRTKYYGKYNYQPQFPNKDGLNYIGLPQIDYINKGAVIAQKVYPILKNIVVEDYDVFFRGGPTYLTDYKLDPNANYINRPGLHTVAVKPAGTGHSWESDWLYNQRLEWVVQINEDKDMRVLEAGLHYTNDTKAEHPLSIQYHMKVFGTDCKNYMSQFTSPNDYYERFMRARVGLNPAGVARSSYRIIELMALQRSILSTDMEGYRYLYNPEVITMVPDGVYIPQAILELSQNKIIARESEKNREIFATLTPQKMWIDVKNQIK